MNILRFSIKRLFIAFLLILSLSSYASEYAEIARNISGTIEKAGKALSQFESAIKEETESDQYPSALITLYYMHLLASNLVLQSSVVGAPSDMESNRQTEYVKLVEDHLRFAISTTTSTINFLRAGESSLPDNTLLRSSFKRFIEEIEEGESYVGNFFLVSGLQKPGDVINVEIKE